MAIEHWISQSGLGGLQLGADPGGLPCTLLLHGFTGGAEDWIECWTGDETALALDLPGHGESPDPRGGWDDEMARLLAELPESIDRVVGYSLGGRIALGLLRAAPERFRSFIIVSAHPGISDATERTARRESDLVWIERLRREGVGGFVAAWAKQPLFASQARLSAQVLAQQRTRRLSHRPEGLIASMTVFGLAEMPDTWADLQRFTGDLSWIVGAEDHKFADIARRLLELRPKTRLCVLPGVGHNPLLETPRQMSALLDR